MATSSLRSQVATNSPQPKRANQIMNDHTADQHDGRRTPSPGRIPTNSEIEHIIQMATTRTPPSGRAPSGKDTRTQLFVGNLPYRVRWQDLKDLFRKAGGTVLRADVSLGPDNRSRGYGTVLLASAEDAGRAIDMFNGYVWQTRTLEVRPDRLPADLDQVLGIKPSVSSIHSYGAPSPLHTMGYIASALAGAPPQHSLSGPANGLSMQAASLAATGNPLLDKDDLRQPLSASRSFTFTPSPLSQQPFEAPPTSLLVSQSSFVAPQQQASLPPASAGTANPDPLSRVSSANLAGRTLFVGNLPFDCQWQDLKDLFRTSGNVIRADVSTQPDGKPRGFGTVVFSTEAEAERAVETFNGMQYRGRDLKVYLDRFTQSQTTNQEGSSDTSSPRTSSATANNAIGGNGATNGIGHFPPAYSMHPSVHPGHIIMPPSSTAFNLASAPTSPFDAFPPPLMAYQSTSGAHIPPAPVSPVTTVPLNGGIFHSSTYQGSGWPPSPPTTANVIPAPPPSQVPAPTGATTSRGAGPHPGPITLPGPLPPVAFSAGPLSPLGLPPITPSMPSFTFMPPQATPPLHPHAFMSPGVGPFSPVGSPAYYGHVNPYFNHAPGAPVYYPHPEGTSPGYFDMTAATAGSDAPQGYFPLMPDPAAEDAAKKAAEERDKRELAMDEPLAPVGVGLDGFPSLAAPQPKRSESVSTAGGTTATGKVGEDGPGSTFAFPVTLCDDSRAPPSQNGGSTSSGSGGPIYSSNNKPKLHLGALPRKAFSPPAASVNGKLPAGRETANCDGAHGSTLVGGDRADSIVGTAALPGVGPPSGFRDSLSVDAETGGARRSSWTEAPSRRQGILNGMSK